MVYGLRRCALAIDLAPCDVGGDDAEIAIEQDDVEGGQLGVPAGQLGRALAGTVHPHLPTLRYRRSAKWKTRIGRLRPISLPQYRFDATWRDAPFPEKTHDLFFVGAVDGNSTVREAGLAELERLRAQGVRIDQPTERLPYDAFMERMSRSWLAWSPEGMGWDCYRHYEAPIVQTVPVMNNPTILRHALATRMWHWVNAVSVFILLGSGLGISNAHPRLYWGRYGANFEFMLPLDADRLMSGNTIRRMVRMAQAYPKLGIFNKFFFALSVIKFK